MFVHLLRTQNARYGLLTPGLAVLDTPYQGYHRHGPPMAQASVAESSIALPPVKGSAS